MPSEDFALPESASNLDLARSDAIETAYIKNPVFRNPAFDQERISPLEAFHAIGLLAAALQCDEFRINLASRRLTNGN